MPDNPSNGTKRFEDLAHRVDTMDDKLDLHGEALARIEARLSTLQCAVRGPQIDQLRLQVERLESGAQISVAKVGALAGVIAAVVAFFGQWLSSWK